MYYAIEEGKVVNSGDDVDAVIEWCSQRLLSNPTIGASLVIAKTTTVLVSSKAVEVNHVDTE